MAQVRKSRMLGAWYTECGLEMMQTQGGNCLWELHCAEPLYTESGFWVLKLREMGMF